MSDVMNAKILVWFEMYES